MKINIIFPFKDGPYGGGNQFLKALRDEFRKSNNYVESPEQASVFLFNSFQDIRAVIRLKYRFPNAVFVHRVDGPISLYRNSPSNSIDKLIYLLNDAVADATIFQSRFSQDENRVLGISKKSYETIIYNAPDPTIFFPKTKFFERNRKTRIISTSWSANQMKGFDIYEYLDRNLDFSRYEYTFVGNSPVTFQNIQLIPPQDSKRVAELLRSSDIYITASRKDPCSNSLIEAISCSLPVVALNDGGHPELVVRGGELFNNAEEALEKIRLVVINYEKYQQYLPIFILENKAKEYIDFLATVRAQCEPRRLTIEQSIEIALRSYFHRI